MDGSLGLDEEDTYGIPSGHVQGATTMYLFISFWLRRNWVWALCLTLILLMGLSRVYLGVHFVHDTVAAAAIAILVLAGYFTWQRHFYERFRNRILGQRLMFMLLVVFLFVVLYIGVRFALGAPDMDVAWAEYIDDAEQASLEHVATAVGSLLGLGLGFVLEISWVRFKETGPWWKKILRYVVGMAVAAAIVFGLKAVFPTDPLWLAIPLRIFRYFLGSIWIAYYAPLLFVRLKLADAHTEPEIKLTVSSEGLMQQ